MSPRINEMARRVRDVVELGQRFKRSSVVWEVMRISPIYGIFHAEIMKVGYPTEVKLISVSALLESSDFTQE